MKKNILNGHYYGQSLRPLMLLCLSLALLLNPSNMFGGWYGEEGSGGWTPTSCGLVLNFEPGDQFYLTTVIGGVEYFVCDYQGYKGGKFNYKEGDQLKLIPAPSATTAPAGSVWTVDAPLERVFGGTNYALGGIIYTMWSDEGRTLITDSTSKNENYVYNGKIAKADRNPKNANTPAHSLCDVVFAVPTIRSTSADPLNSLKRAAKQGDPFDGQTGEGWNGQIYREVYWFHKARKNGEYTYTNTALTAVNTGNGVIWQINAKDNGSGLRDRTLFRIYPINKPFSTCPNSFFFAWDVQDFLKYRKTNNVPGTKADSTDAKTGGRKIYTLDHLYCMEEVESTPNFQTDEMQIPPSDSTYFYVGRNNKYHNSGENMAFGPGSGGAISQFTSIRQLRVRALKDAEGADTLFTPKAGAYGRMVIDTTSSANNLGVTFEPTGYFLRTNSRMNIPMHSGVDETGTYWQTEDTWTITAELATYRLKATLLTGATFSVSDPGADIRGWSQMVGFKDIRLPNGDTIPFGTTGWARLYPGNSSANGGLVFIPADQKMYITYDNNGNFGDTIPDQHAPAVGTDILIIEQPRLLEGYNFTEWNTERDGSGRRYAPGATINMDTLIAVDGKKVLHLYAQATYNGEINVAISFLKEDGKRYFLMYPGGAPRFSHARHFDDWTNVRQGMKDAYNNDPHYLTTYLIIGKPTCIECKSYEYVLDPIRHTMRGGTDSLVFYQNYAPEGNEYLGLYYDNPYTVIANNTWAGLFQSSEGWPTPTSPCISNTKFISSHYLHNLAAGIGNFTRSQRPLDPTLAADTVIHYNAAADQFDGGTMAQATNFMISGVGVVDAHYVILPDTTDMSAPWVDEITFNFIENEPVEQRVWSQLIGKQLLAQMMVGDEIIYFHPNEAKTFTTANELRLSLDYSLVQTFTFIPDRRGGADTVSAAFRPSMSATGNEFSQLITSGTANPMDVQYTNGEGVTSYIDICDTIRVRLTPRSASKIKAYYGRWKTGSPGLVVAKDGSRYRDIIVRTKTYHYGAKDSTLVLTPAQDQYLFSPLVGQSQRLNFKLQKQVFRWLQDASGANLEKEIISITDVTTGNLSLATESCSFTSANPSTYFDVTAAASDSIILTTKTDNMSQVRLDTLIVSIPEKTLIGETHTFPAFTTRIPLMQTKLEGEELIWSVVHSGTRYYITAGSGGLIYRQYRQDKSILYKLGTSTQLIKGSKDAANSEAQYITPWKYEYAGRDGLTNKQLKLKTEYGVNMAFVISGETTPTLTADTPTVSILTYEYVKVNTNSNANFEEQVRLKYGSDKWLKFRVSKGGTPYLALDTSKDSASVFYWSYLNTEYSLLNNGTYPNPDSLEFNYNRLQKTVQTCYKAYREYSMMLDSAVVYLGRINRDNIDTLTNAAKEWKTAYTVTFKRDERFAEGAGGLSIDSTTTATLTTYISASETVPMDKMIGGKYVNIVDTLDFAISLQTGAPEYRFKDKWSSFKSINDAHLKIPLVSKTYHKTRYDSLVCSVDGDRYNYTFPASVDLETGASVTFDLSTERRRGVQLLDVDNHVVAVDSVVSGDIPSGDNVVGGKHTGWNLKNKALAEMRLIDEYGNTPTWCHVSDTTTNSVSITCTVNGIRSPRTAYLYIAYLATVNDTMHFVNFRLSVSQPSFFQYANNQILVHSAGASGDPLMEDGRQRAHENKRVLYYYNPSITPEADQNVELPIRERGFYGWWRWYEESEGVNEADIPAATWQTPPRNVGKHDFPYRIIGDSVWNDENDHSKGKKLVTMGRYTVFHYPSREYNDKNDPPAKAPMVYPPTDKSVKIYVADISNYYDNLPLSTEHKNQIDTARLDTMQQIIEPTLSLREVFELRPWTEMADTMEHYKVAVSGTGVYRNEKYMEDHVMMAPVGNRLLLRTEQRYNYDNLKARGHSESLLGYYMHDDNRSSWPSTGQDTMIWCGGWDVDCEWYTYNPDNGKYTKSSHKLTQGDDFLDVPARAGLPSGKEFDTVYYCLRARSVATTAATDKTEETVNYEGGYWFNICRYMVIYHAKTKYGPLEETSTNGVKKALMTNEEIEQTYEVLERLNFDYNKPSSDYTVYPHPLPWADGSYGYSYPVGPEIPDNRYHNDFAPNFPGPGEYSIINRIVNQKYCRSMDQHGGAENGYMIYCDGMSSAGQVAALNLNTVLCEGQKMYFSGYVGNVSNQNGKANPNFHISVQGSTNGTDWTDITSYTTGDIQPSNNWYQIFFPINFNIKEGSASNMTHFRVRIYNMASTYDGNDFVIDDMCLFATKPPLIAYQANSACVEKGESDSITHVVIRVDYQGFTDDAYKGAKIYYAVDKIKGKDTTFIEPIDKYIGQDEDTICGRVKMPSPTYEPESSDSIFTNFRELSERFEETLAGHTRHPDDTAIFQQGYIYENIDNTVRPVLYIIHKAQMTPDCQYMVRMSLSYRDLHSSICAMTSSLKVSNRMVLELNGEERESMDNSDLCANTTYDVGLRVKGMQFADNSAPLAVNGTCMSDWLPGDTTDAGCMARYGYHYDVIVDVLQNILRCEPKLTTNPNQFAPNLAAVNHDKMLYVQTSEHVKIGGTYEPEKGSANDPYVILTNLVDKGLILYQAKKMFDVVAGDSVQCVIFPIIGSGSEEVKDANVEICPEPIFCKLKPKASQATPLIIGGSMRDPLDKAKPVVIVADSATIATSGVTVLVNYISAMRKLHSIRLLSTDDSHYREGVHTLNMVANNVTYTKGENMVITPAVGNNYAMRPGYNYTFGIVMQTMSGYLEDEGCPVGTIPFTIAVVPNYLRWDPQTETANKWNDPNNWIGITQQNVPIQENARFAPQSHTMVVIPPLTDGRLYPELVDMAVRTEDSIRQVGFQYNTCSAIRFMPGATIGSQQLLTYTDAIIDMSTPQGKWALRAAPVKGMLSGDIFMSNADLNWGTSPWEVGEFDASGRNYTTGNASFWLSFYSRSVTQKGNMDQVSDSTRTAAAEWSRVANGMTESIPAGQGWAIYTKTNSGKDATVRLPKNDDTYYYYTADGEKADERLAHHDLRTLRNTYAGGSEYTGKLAFNASSFSFTVTNAVKSPLFVFGNPTMGYIDIWGFIADNSASPALIEEFDYLNASGEYTTITKEAAEAVGSEDVITNPLRYLPPMHGIVLKVAVADSAYEKALTLNANRVVTDASQVVRALPTPAPSRNAYGRSKGIMTVTAVNPADKICKSRLLLGQGYHDGILNGEDAVLTTINVDNFSSSTPSTPFNLYAAEGSYGLSIDLRDEIVNVPISFYNTPLPYEPVSYLWFTGVNNIEGSLVLYDALTDTERPIFDGICLDIETPQTSHEARYYIRRPGYLPDEPTTPTGVVQFSTNDEPVVKIIRDGHVLILRNGHVYTMFGQKIR